MATLSTYQNSSNQNPYMLAIDYNNYNNCFEIYNPTVTYYTYTDLLTNNFKLIK